MKKWQKQLMTLIVSLGFSEKVTAGTLTAEEQRTMAADYETTYGTSLEADRQLNEDLPAEQNLLSAEDIASIATLLSVEPAKAPQTAPAAVKTLITTAQTQQQQIATLVAEPEPQNVAHVQASGAASSSRMLATVLGHTPHTETHLFGIESPMYARTQWWNQISGKNQINVKSLKKPEKESFMTAFAEYGEKLSERALELSVSNQISLLNYQQMIAGEGHVDYSNLQTTVEGLAGEYVVRRQDLILAYFRSLPSVSTIFPTVSGVQNKELAPTATFGELSQGDREGRIFKGGVEFAAEVYQVVAVMFKYQFNDMIALEKKYIGYLNRENSDVIKWSFIEWIMVYFGKQLLNEQNRRRVVGVAVPQQDVVANPAMLAADGVLRAIERVEEELKVLPFADLALYTSSSMLDYAYSFTNKIVQILDNPEGFVLFANLKHKPWYVALWAEKYGAYTGTVVAGQQLPDLHPDKIVWVPNIPMNNFKMWMTLPGNIELYEDKPMEMLAFIFFPDFEAINVRSRWKEGAGVLQPGAKFATKAALTASERKLQWLFTNYPASALALTSSVSLAANNLFTISGTTLSGGTDAGVTTVTGASIETVYKFVAGSDFASTLLKKAGAFSKISADFDPAAEGDYIKVYAELADVDTTIDGKTVKVTTPTGKFLELERKVTA